MSTCNYLQHSGSRINLCLLLVMFLISAGAMAQSQRANYNLAALSAQGSILPENRTVSALPDGKTLKVSAAQGSGVVWLNNANFTNGVIEVDLRGKDIKQGSFVGIAFRGTSKDDCEAVYFRPFNFMAKDSAARAHMVQYVMDTTYGWERLRTEHRGMYENKLVSPPDPNGWFHVKLDIQGKIIKVYVNNETKPCLEVISLNKKKSGKVGLWVGNSSEGEFANLVVEMNSKY